jgi:hypothetical protein
VYAREARLLRTFERDVTLRAASTFVVTEKEQNTLMSIAPGAPIDVIPNGVDASQFRRPESEETSTLSVVFCGVMKLRTQCRRGPVDGARGVAAGAAPGGLG